MRKHSLLLLTLFGFLVAAVADDKPAQPQVYKGTLATGIVAIGGETTGVTLAAKEGKTYELDFGNHADLAKLAESLNGKHVAVTGVLHTKPGVETARRHIIEVTALKADSR
jgi:hypothetical protein